MLKPLVCVHCTTGSHDRSLRRWERTSEPFFVEEEKEKRLESLFEADVESGDQAAGADMPTEGGEASATAGQSGRHEQYIDQCTTLYQNPTSHITSHFNFLQLIP